MHHGQVPLLLAATALDEAAYVWSTAAPWPVPTLVLHGTDDTYTDPRASTDFAGLLGPQAELRLLQGGRHELLNDHVQNTTAEFVLQWLTRHT
jgi:acylglycerol lipase